MRRRLQLLDLARQRLAAMARCLKPRTAVGDVGQVAHAPTGDDRHLVRAVACLYLRQAALARLQTQLLQTRQQRLVQRRHAVVVEPAGHRAEHGHLLRRLLPGFLVALDLLGDVAQRIRSALAVELVDRDEFGEVKHVDFLELAGRAEFGCHHVHRHVDQRHDRRVALADAAGLDDDEIEAGGLAGGITSGRAC
jgi:hypothetical protein